MKPVVSMVVVMGAFLAVAGISTHAYAVTPQKASKAQTTAADVINLAPLSPTTVDTFSNDAAPNFSQKSQSKVYAFNLKGKWGVKFDVNQPETTPSGFNDVDAGAFYKLSPSVRVAGTLGFGEKTTDAFKAEPSSPAAQAAKTQPRVRLETTFKF
ncbi:MAG: NtrZ family periplasmic regulatory protein [Asticcacaulis sp.]